MEVAYLMEEKPVLILWEEEEEVAIRMEVVILIEVAIFMEEKSVLILWEEEEEVAILMEGEAEEENCVSSRRS